MSETPETPTELVKRLWDTAIQHLEQATEETDVATSDAYCRIGELALMAAQFALNNQVLLVGGDVTVLPDSPLPPSPSGIPGAPPLPIWGTQR